MNNNTLSRVELSNSMHTRMAKFLAALLGYDVFELKRMVYACAELYRGLFFYQESDRMGIYKWKEGELPFLVFNAKHERGFEYIAFLCPSCKIRYVYETWGEDSVDQRGMKDINVFEERICEACSWEKQVKVKTMIEFTYEDWKLIIDALEFDQERIKNTAGICGRLVKTIKEAIGEKS